MRYLGQYVRLAISVPENDIAIPTDIEIPSHCNTHIWQVFIPPPRHVSTPVNRNLYDTFQSHRRMRNHVYCIIPAFDCAVMDLKRAPAHMEKLLQPPRTAQVIQTQSAYIGILTRDKGRIIHADYLKQRLFRPDVDLLPGQRHGLNRPCSPAKRRRTRSEG